MGRRDCVRRIRVVTAQTIVLLIVTNGALLIPFPVAGGTGELPDPYAEEEVRPASGLVADAGPDLFTAEGQPVGLSASATLAVTWMTIWTDDFESYALGPLTSPWVDESAGGTNYAEISNVIARGGSGQSIHLVDTTGGPAGLGTTAARSIFATRVELTTWAYALQTTGVFSPMLSSPGGPAEWQNVRAGMGSTGQFIYDICMGVGWSTSPVTYVAGQWYEIQLVADIARDSYDMYVDGGLIASDVPLCGSASVFDMVREASAGSYVGEFYVDDITYREGQPVPVVDYSWDLNAVEDVDGDGNFTNDRDLVGPSGTVTYGDDGDYVVTLTVTDAIGAVANDTAIVSVSNAIPQLNVTLDTPVSMTVGASLTVDVLDNGSDDLTITWNWSDGALGNQTLLNGGLPDPPMSPNGTFPFVVNSTVNRTFPAPGTYEVNVTVEDDDNGSVSVNMTVEVRDVPATTLTIGPPNYVASTTYIDSTSSLSLSATDRSGFGINATYYAVNGGSPMTYAGPFTLTIPGPHALTYWSTDLLGGLEPENAANLFVDLDPPTTLLSVTGPQLDQGGTRWITSAAELSLQASDDGAGVADTQYRVWDGTVWSPWDSAPIPMAPPVSDGPFDVEFYSVDLLGHLEAVVSVSFTVDDAPPTTSLQIGQPAVDDWIAPSTMLSLTATDAGVGVDVITYRVWHSGTWSAPDTYAGPFSLTTGDGRYHVEYFATDLLGNEESPLNVSLRVDGTPPDVAVHVTHSDAEYAFTVELDATDAGSGVDTLEYRIDGGPWSEYTGPFTLRGRGLTEITVRATDRVGNEAEPESSFISPLYVNYKLWLALLFVTAIVAVGLLVAWKRPDARRAVLTITSLFAAIEITLGIASALFGVLLFPPLLGIGFFLNLAITIGGVVAILVTGWRARTLPPPPES